MTDSLHCLKPQPQPPHRRDSLKYNFSVFGVLRSLRVAFLEPELYFARPTAVQRRWMYTEERSMYFGEKKTDEG